MSDRSRRELEDRIDELEATLEDLRREVGPRRGPTGLPRPPSPRGVLRFTDEYAIPAAIAALEANVRALELLQAGIRATDRERAVDGTGRAIGGRAADVGRASLDRLDVALADLESALEGSGMPRNRQARDLLGDARRLNEEIREMVETGEAPAGRGWGRGGQAERSGAIRIEVEEEDAGGRSERSVAEEVETELETVREEVEAEGERGNDRGDDGEPDDAEE
jgi:hypothetical protein